MIEAIVNNTWAYTETHDKDNRKKKGQFFTPASIADFMALKASYAAEHLSILEPGAGNGILTAAVVKRCIDDRLCNSFTIKFVENDKEILPILEENVGIIREYVLSHGGQIDISISIDNYITGNDSQCYDIVICNPPYKKIRKDSQESQAMAEYVHGQPNLYGLFMCKALRNLKNNGRFVFITPRSWVSGEYYRKVRENLLQSMNLTDLLLFENRDKIFEGEDVLQETLITVGVKNAPQSQYIYVYTADADLQLSLIQMEVPARLIKDIGEDSYLLLPQNEEDLQVIYRMSQIPDTFEGLGYCFKTGPVVEFRNKEAISSEQRAGYIPMYRASHIVEGKCVFPADTEKAQYVDATVKKLLISNRNTVFIRRLSAKEENRRLQSCAYYQLDGSEHISVENHVNYLTRSDGNPLSVDEVDWINGLLMSEDYDTYYRIINGSTQVNAGEINKLPLQRRS